MDSVTEIPGTLADQVIGHRLLFSQWNSLLERDQLTGSFLFVGPAGVGKKKSAWAFMQQSLCEKNRDRTRPPRPACGECSSCRRVSHHQHESVLLIEPEGALIKVEQGHQILQFIRLQALQSHRFILIDEAHRLHPAVANSLLKSLEEPPEGTTFILLAPSLTSVLPTLRSRLRVFHFQPVPLEQIRAVKSVPEWVLEASLGRFDLLEVLETTEERQLRLQWGQTFVTLMTSGDSLIEDSWRDQMKNKEELKWALDLWLKMVRDAQFYRAGEKRSLRTLDLKDSLEKLAQLPDEILQEIGQGLIELQKEMNFNKDVVLSIESLYIRIHSRS
jgi:DNA polymerase-3 subunit delta'